MTDDERMDRARRIREMRDGSRPTDDAQDGDDGAAEAADTEADGGTGADTDDGADADADDGADADADAGDSTADAGDERHDVDTAADDAGDESVSARESDDGPAESGDAEAAVDEESAAAESADDGSDEGATMHVPGAEVGDVDVDLEEMARQAGLTAGGDGAGDDADAGFEAVDDDPAEAGAPAAAARQAAVEAGGESVDETRVLEFTLGAEQYCLDIEYVEEIVKREAVTRVPNTPDCVEGVVDLRGQITTILDPKELLDIDETGSKDLIVVFDPDGFDDQGAVGWVVDDVEQVTPIADDEVNDPPVDGDHINGVVDRDGEFVIWTTPELDIDEVAG